MEITFESKKFEIFDEDDETEGTFVRRAGNFFVAELQKKGYNPHIEINGWNAKISIKDDDIDLYVIISATWKENLSEGESMIAFKCTTGYNLGWKGKILSTLGKISPDEKLAKLNWAVKEILSKEKEIKIKNIQNDVLSI